MLTGRLLHPQVLAALAGNGHGAQVLIADGNFPLVTGTGPNAQLVYLNLEPGKLTATEVLDVIRELIPVEAAHVMGPADGSDPEIFAEFRRMLPGVELTPLGRFEFYDMARGQDCALAMSTGEQRLFGNILLTIGVVQPGR